MSRPPLGEGLANWLTEQEGRPVEVRGLEQASAGARRLNVLFEAVSGVESRKLALTMIPSAAIQLLDVAGEAAVRTLAEEAGVPVPHVHHVCRDDAVLGGPFFISTAVDGETVPRRVLRLVEQTGVGPRVVAQLGDAMARLHSIDAAVAPPDLVRTNLGPIEAAMRSVDDLLKALLTPSPTFSYGARWLERHAPSEPSRRTIVHSDIRTGNIIVGDDGLRAILDWEGTRIGDPMEDLAWPCQRMWRFREDALTVGGMAGVDVLRTAYESAGGDWDDDRFRWWRVLGTVRWGMSLADRRGPPRRQLPVDRDGRQRPSRAELEYDALLLLRPR